MSVKNITQALATQGGEQENAPTDLNDKKVKCGDCKYYTFDCEKGIDVIDENALHNCELFELYVKKTLSFKA